VGDRLIPVGVTSGRVHALSPEEAQAEGVDNGGSRRARRRQQPNQNQNFEQFMGMGGQDLEEVSIESLLRALRYLTDAPRKLMLMEAMRLSMIDHEEHQRKEAEEKRKQEAAAVAAAAESPPTSSSAPGPSLLDPTARNLISFSPSPSTSAPKSNPVFKDSLSISKESLTTSIGRSRTPPQPGPSFQPRSSSPAPYSTLSAALSATSAATAILGSSPSSTHPIANGEAAAAAPPILNTNPEDTPRQTSGDSLHSPLYDILPSSAESLDAYEPLLGSRATQEEGHM
ncbi:hypothetical protein H0H87_004352, partial [Tephrocybe sp. NHM501043]